MSHISELEFTQEHVIPWLKETHPKIGIETKHYIDDPRGFVDIWADMDSHIFAIEVGNNDATIRDEAAQAIEYAADHPAASPMVVVPADHGDQTAVNIWRNHCLIRMLPTD